MLRRRICTRPFLALFSSILTLAAPELYGDPTGLANMTREEAGTRQKARCVAFLHNIILRVGLLSLLRGMLLQR